MKIIFMGSPAFALPSLEALRSIANYEIIRIYTASPKLVRGKLIKTPVHVFADRHFIPVHTPTTLKDVVLPPADVTIVAAYGLLLPTKLLKSPTYGSINIHPSLLPKWRGASPIEHALLHGDKKTGVCIMEVTPKLDAGAIFLQQEVNILPEDNFFTLHDRLAELGSTLLIKVLKELPDIIPQPQAEENITYASKINKNIIDWNMPADYIHRQIKAFGGMSFNSSHKLLKILDSTYELTPHSYLPGEIIFPEFYIACNHGFLKPTLIQVPGKTPLPATEFIKSLPNKSKLITLPNL